MLDLIDIDLAPHAFADADWALLDAAEREQAGRKVQPRDRQRYVRCHAGLRRELAGRLGVAATGLRFCRSPAGRPSLPGSGLDFNLSHSDDRALLAIAASAGARVGVDLERLVPDRAGPGLLAEFVEPLVAAAVDAALARGDLAPFYRCWTAVEALAKARGTGLVEHNPPRLAVLPGAEGELPPLHLPDDTGQARQWRVRCWSPQPGWQAALAWSLSAAPANHRH